MNIQLSSDSDSEKEIRVRQKKSKQTVVDDNESSSHCLSSDSELEKLAKNGKLIRKNGASLINQSDDQSDNQSDNQSDDNLVVEVPEASTSKQNKKSSSKKKVKKSEDESDTQSEDKKNKKKKVKKGENESDNESENKKNKKKKVKKSNNESDDDESEDEKNRKKKSKPKDNSSKNKSKKSKKHKQFSSDEDESHHSSSDSSTDDDDNEKVASKNKMHFDLGNVHDQPKQKKEVKDKSKKNVSEKNAINLDFNQDKMNCLESIFTHITRNLIEDVFKDEKKSNIVLLKESMIEFVENLIRIPIFRHKELSDLHTLIISYLNIIAHSDEKYNPKTMLSRLSFVLHNISFKNDMFDSIAVKGIDFASRKMTKEFETTEITLTQDVLNNKHNLTKKIDLITLPTTMFSLTKSDINYMNFICMSIKVYILSLFIITMSYNEALDNKEKILSLNYLPFKWYGKEKILTLSKTNKRASTNNKSPTSLQVTIMQDEQ